MLKNVMFGFALVLSASVIGIHSCSERVSTKTNTITFQQMHERASCVRQCYGYDDECVKACAVEPVVSLTDVKPCPTVDADAAKKIIAVNVERIAAVTKKFTGRPISAKKKAALRKSIFAKMEAAHVYKFKVTHHHKSNPHKHHHHHGHHHGGHHHHAPQKISGHSAPPYFGCGP